MDASEEVDVAKVAGGEPECRREDQASHPRFFKDGKQYGLDYRQDRTVQALTAFLKQKVELEKTMEDGIPAKAKNVRNGEHPGRMVSAMFSEPRAGQLPHRGAILHHNLNAAMTNLSCREPLEFRDTATTSES